MCPRVRSKKTQKKIISIVLYDVLSSELFPDSGCVSACPLKRDTEFFFRLSLFQNVAMCPCVRSKETQKKNHLNCFVWSTFQTLAVCPCVHVSAQKRHQSFFILVFFRMWLCVHVSAQKRHRKKSSQLFCMKYIPNSGCVSMCPLKRDTKFFFILVFFRMLLCVHVSDQKRHQFFSSQSFSECGHVSAQKRHRKKSSQLFYMM